MDHRIIFEDLLNLATDDVYQNEFFIKKDALMAFSYTLMYISNDSVQEFIDDYNVLELLV